MIYLVQAASGPIKIGFAKNPVRRVQDLRISSHEPLRPLGILEGSQADEAALHRRFAAHHIRGEWFKPHQELLDFAQAHPWLNAPGRLKSHNYGTPLSRWMGRHNLTLEEFGRMIGKDSSSVRRFAVPVSHPNHVTPPHDSMVAIYRATGGAVRPEDFYDLPKLDAAAAPPADGAAA